MEIWRKMNERHVKHVQKIFEINVNQNQDVEMEWFQEMRNVIMEIAMERNE